MNQLLLTDKCELTKRQELFVDAKWTKHDVSFGRNNDEPRSYQIVTYGNSKSTLLATDRNLYKRMAELDRAFEDKGTHINQAGEFMLAKQCQHDDRQQLLVSRKWLAAHEHDVVPEPTIEIAVEGKSLHVNGNYKAGMIKDFMRQYCQHPGKASNGHLCTIPSIFKAKRKPSTVAQVVKHDAYELHVSESECWVHVP